MCYAKKIDPTLLLLFRPSAKKIIVVTIVDIIGLGRYNLGNPIRNYSGALFLTG